MSDKNNNNGYSSLVGFKRAVPIILLALSAFIALCFITQQTGALGKIIAGLLLGLFAKGAYIIPILLALHAIFFAPDIAEGRMVSRIVFSLTALVSVSAVIYTVTNFGSELVFSASKFYSDGMAGVGGGFIGSTVAFGIIKIFGHVGLIIIAAVVIALYVSFFFAKGRGAAKRSIYGVLIALAKLGARIENALKSFIGKIRAKKQKRSDRISQQKTDELFNDEYFAVDNGLKELSIPALGIHESRSERSLEENPTLQSKVRHKSAEEFFTERKEQKKQDFNTDYGFDGSTASFKSSAEIYTEYTEMGQSERASLGLDCSADEIFTKSFSPIDFALDSEEANRPSSRSAYTPTRTEEAKAPEIKETVRAITEQDIEMARRKADFDMKKRSAFDSYRSPSEAKAEKVPETENVYTRESYDRAAEFLNGVNAEYTRTIHIPEAQPAHEASPTPSYTSVGYTPNISQAPAYETSAYAKEAAQASTYATRSYEAESITLASDAAHKDVEDVTFSYEDNTVTDAPISTSFEYTEPLDKTDSVTESEPTSVYDADAIEPDISYAEPSEVGTQTKISSISISRTMLSPTSEILELIPEESTITLEDEEDIQIEDCDDTPDEPEEKPAAAPITRNLYTYSDELGKSDGARVLTHNTPEPEKCTEKKPARPDYSKYKFPPLELLAKGESAFDQSLNEEMDENGNKIIETLASFNVLASIKGYDRGPRITRYEVVPAKGVRVNQVVNLFDDIALSLAAEGIRIEAPIPGKSAIGFELPNKTPETVRLRDLLECDEFKNAPSKTLACIGKDVTGSPVFGDIAKMPHVLIAGATGMGKSVCINSILISILYKARPDEVKFILIDPKKVEFKMYNGIPHLLVPVVSDAKQAAGALMWAVEEMERRYDAIESLNVRNIEGYNEKVRDNPKLGEPLPKLIIVIDELNDLMLQVRDPVEGLIMSIAQKARAAGIHLIIGTQRPSVNVITGVIKANIPSRMSCKVASYTDSKTILERAGAERLLDKGDMLYHPVGTPKPIRVQSAFVSDPEVYAVMDALKENKDMVSYDDKVMEDITRAAQRCVKGKGGAADDGGADDGGAPDSSSYMHDKQFLDAVDIAVTSGKISTSLIQRRIGVGYGKAAKFIDIMESLGIVSEPNGQKPRETLITKDDWMERLANY